MAIVADTHAIIWYLVEPERLSQIALDALEGSIVLSQRQFFDNARYHLDSMCDDIFSRSILSEKDRSSPIINYYLQPLLNLPKIQQDR